MRVGFRDISLQRKLLLIIMMTSGVVILLTSVSFGIYDWVNANASLVRRLETMADIVGSNCTASLICDNADDSEATLAGLRAEGHVVGAVVYNDAGEPFALYHRESVSFTPPPVESQTSRFDGEFLVTFRPIVIDSDTVGVVYLKSDLKELDDRLSRYLQVVTAFVLAAGLVAFLVASRLRTVVTKPIMGLLDTMRIVSDQRTYSIRATKHGEDELGRLVDGFNSMLTQIEDRDAALRSSLSEKEVLLKEIHHRVKNNLQIVSSLLNLQSGHIQDEATAAMLRDSQNRIRSMALGHERLYGSENLARTNLREYVDDLCRNVMRSYVNESRGVTMRTEVDDVAVDIDTAIPCGLIINELVSNALKHAFGEGGGEISVQIGIADDSYELTVSDDGTGFPVDVDVRSPKSLGLKLVNTLVRQLRGTFDIGESQGSEVRITFPCQRP